MNAAPSSNPDPTLGATILQGYVVASHLRSEVRGECYRGRSVREGEGDVVIRFMSRSIFAPAPRTSWSPLWAYAERLQRLDHPNLERILECGMVRLGEDDRFCVVSEAIDGDTLLAHIKSRGRLEVGDALTLGRQIAQGMSTLHRLGVVHGDLRVSNIVLARSASNDGADLRPVVCELGLTHLALQAEGASSTLRAMMISPESIAPEQIRGEPVTMATDIYAFGTILYRMITGLAAFQGDNTSQTLRAHLTRSPAALKDRVADAPDSIEALVRGCLARRPEGRFPSFDALLAQLHECEARILSIASTRSPSWKSPRAAASVPLAPRASIVASPPHASSPAPADRPLPALDAPCLDDDGTPSTPHEPAHENLTRDDLAHDDLSPSDVTEEPPTPAPRAAPVTRRTRTLATRTAPSRWLRLATVIIVALGAAAGYAASSTRARPAASATANVRFEVRSSAHSATATIRGRAYPVPIEVELSPGRAPEAVEVSAAGYTTRRVSIIVDRSMRVELDLEPATSSAPH